jgi:protein MAK11
VVWRDDGEEFAVGFERGVVVFGLDCEVRGAIKVDGSKVCQVRLVPGQGVLAVSTEDGRVLVYDTNVKNAVKGEVLKEGKKFGKDAAPPPPMCKMLGQVGTSSRGSRVKDFEIFKTMEEAFVLVTGTSDGAVRLWTIDQAELLSEDCTIATSTSDTTATPETDGKTASPSIRQIGTLLATHETGRRITCLTGFVMDQPGDAAKYAGRSKKVKAHDRGDEDGGVEIGGEEEPDISADSDGEGEEFGGFDE